MTQSTPLRMHMTQISEFRENQYYHGRTCTQRTVPDMDFDVDRCIT